MTLMVGALDRTRVRARALLVLILLLAASGGCFGGGDESRTSLVPYPRIGDVAEYEASGALVDFARWDNGVPFASASAQVRYTVSSSADALDGARAIHPSYRVTTEVAEAGVFGLRSERWVSARHGTLVQSFFPLSQDQSVVAFDERGFPWLFGASALFGEELREGTSFDIEVPDNLGRGMGLIVTASYISFEDGAHKLALTGPGVSGALWMEPGAAWPARVELSLAGPGLAPHVRCDGGYPVTLAARRVALTPGAEPVTPRDRAATYGEDPSALRARWDGEAPPDGDLTTLEYPLSEAIRDAKLLDKPLADWLAAHDEPRIYRGTYQIEAGPVEGSAQAHWLLQWVDESESYYEVQIARVLAPPLPVGVPRVETSAPAEPPADKNHGWFARDAVPDQLVTLSEGVRVVREVFGAQEIQIFLRSFADPPGYSYFIDGGFEGPGRYTVVYNPSTGFVEEATGPVQPRLA